jgi:hypothetical protein
MPKPYAYYYAQPGSNFHFSDRKPFKNPSNMIFSATKQDFTKHGTLKESEGKHNIPLKVVVSSLAREITRQRQREMRRRAVEDEPIAGSRIDPLSSSLSFLSFSFLRNEESDGVCF